MSHRAFQWATYTPAWTSTGSSPSIGNGTLAGSYYQAGGHVLFRVALTWGSTTNAGSGDYRFSVPVAGDTGTALDGRTRIADATVTDRLYGGLQLYWVTSTTISPGVLQSSFFKMYPMGPGFPISYATSDSILIQGRYVAA